MPKLSLNYVTTGVWENDALIESMFEASKKEIDQSSLFSSIEWMAAGAKKIRTKYLHTKNSISVTFDASKNLILPVIPKSSESYLVLVSNKELEKIITDEDGGIRKNLFFENIRDYNPLSKVNNSIKETLLSKEAIEFPFKNNGITIVTKSFHRVGDNFTIEDFQIVNGCQTSHVVHECSGKVEDEFFIPAKIICTDDEELTERIIIASNRQNEVTDEMFWSLKQIHKDFEIFFKSKSDDQALYYERRSGQYNTSDVEKVRIVSKDGLLKAYASMFLEEPNKVGRHYGDLVPLVGGKIFKEGDKPHSYYSAAYASFRLEWLFRNNRIDKKYKPFRHLMLMASRLIVEKEENWQNSKKVSEAYCNKIDKRMFKVDKSIDLFMKSVSHIESALAALGYEDDTTRRVAKMRDVKDKVRETICSG